MAPDHVIQPCRNSLVAFILFAFRVNFNSTYLCHSFRLHWHVLETAPFTQEPEGRDLWAAEENTTAQQQQTLP